VVAASLAMTVRGKAGRGVSLRSITLIFHDHIASAVQFPVFSATRQ
jgi:hypothetical protein